MTTTSSRAPRRALAAFAALALGTTIVLASGTAVAHAPSGAIFTSLGDGEPVNFNIYPSKDDVYLDGGPGVQAPQGAAGLDDGTYVFQVTDPSGKVLLSQDEARCRQVIVADGVFSSVVAQPDGCEHLTGINDVYGSTPVQLMPYADTPNNGGVYKAWVTTVDDYLRGCAGLGEPDGLNVVDCGQRGGNSHGFVGAHSKTDNFKVGDEEPGEIDVRFRNEATGQWMLGKTVTWYDTNGAQNTKHSEFAPQINVNYEAHVEAVENGFHSFDIADQAGCIVHDIWVGGVHYGQGAQIVTVQVKPNSFTASNFYTIWIDVDCHDD